MPFLDHHFTMLNKCGGYTRNERGAIQYSRDMDRVDGQVGLMKALEKNYMITQSTNDFQGLQPKKRTSPYGLVAGRSAFTAGAPTRPHNYGISAANMALPNPKYEVASNVRILSLVPGAVVSEAQANYNLRALRQGTDFTINQGDTLKSNCTGYNSNFMGNPLLGRGATAYPSIMMASVSRCDYRPRALRTGSEKNQLVSSKGSVGTGFAVIKELAPAFLPPTKIYGVSDPAYESLDRYSSMYTLDYPFKSRYCDPTGKRVIEIRLKGGASGAMESNVRLDHGYNNNNQTETVASYNNKWPLPGVSTMWLGRPVDGLSSSGFQYAEKRHSNGVNECKGEPYVDKDACDAPQRYNPWTRLLFGFKALTDPCFRPHPVTDGKEFVESTGAPTTSHLPTTYFY